MNYTLISSKSIAADFIKRYGTEGESLDESLIRSISDDTLSKIIDNQARVYNIVFIDIENFTGKLPRNYVSTIQCAFRLKKNRVLKNTISEFIQKLPGNKCVATIRTKCPACNQDQCDCGRVVAEIDIDTIWRMSNPEHVAAASKFFTDYANQNKYPYGIHDEGWKLMNRATSNWFSTKYYLGDCSEIVPNMLLEYKIFNGKIITNFEKGEVVLVYFGESLDEDGYKMVPNTTRVIEAITTAIMYIMMQKRYFISLQQEARMAMEILHRNLETQILRARTDLNFPEYDEFMSIIHNDWRKMYNPLHWFQQGARIPDTFNPSNNYNFQSEY